MQESVTDKQMDVLTNRTRLVADTSVQMRMFFIQLIQRIAYVRRNNAYFTSARALVS